MAKFVDAVFHNRRTKTNVSGSVGVPSGTRGTAVAARIACQDYAWDNGFSHWAHFDSLTQSWHVFECRGRSDRLFLTEMPTQAAAEVWLVHRG